MCGCWFLRVLVCLRILIWSFAGFHVLVNCFVFNQQEVLTVSLIDSFLVLSNQPCSYGNITKSLGTVLRCDAWCGKSGLCCRNAFKEYSSENKQQKIQISCNISFITLDCIDQFQWIKCHSEAYPVILVGVHTL